MQSSARRGQRLAQGRTAPQLPGSLAKSLQTYVQIVKQGREPTVSLRNKVTAVDTRKDN